MYQDPNISEMGYIYGKWMTTADTYVISFQGRVYSYLLIGTQKALLIDTAYGEGNLRYFVEQITDKPVMVVNTHGHFDHTGGNPWWEEVYASEKSLPDIKTAFSPEMQAEFQKKPYPDYKVNFVSEGYLFDLGGRTVEVLEIPAHSPSSIALLDSGSRYLFTGDELEAGQVLIFGDQAVKCIEAHKKNMEKLKGRSGEFDFLCPAHNGNPISKKYIDDFIELDRQILDGTQRDMPTTAGFGFPPDAGSLGIFSKSQKTVRSQYGGASICYTANR